MNNTNIRTIALIDKDDKITLFKVRPEDEVTLDAEFLKNENDDTRNPVIIPPKTLKKISVQLEYTTPPEIVCIQGTIGTLINGIYN